MTRSTKDQVTKDVESQSTPQHISPISPDIYRTLIEQQAILSHTINKDEEINKETILIKDRKIISKGETLFSTLKAHEIRDSCSEKFSELTTKSKPLKSLPKT